MTQQALSQEDREQLAAELQAVFSTLHRILAACPPACLNNRTQPGSWSPAEITQHIIKSTAGIPDGNTQSPARAYDALEETLKSIFLNLEKKYEAPDFVVPENKMYQLEALQEALRHNQSIVEDLIQNKDLSLLCMDAAFPGIGYMTRWEWIRFMLYHTQRHTLQLHKTLQQLHEKN